MKSSDQDRVKIPGEKKTVWFKCACGDFNRLQSFQQVNSQWPPMKQEKKNQPFTAENLMGNFGASQSQLSSKMTSQSVISWAHFSRGQFLHMHQGLITAFHFICLLMTLIHLKHPQRLKTRRNRVNKDDTEKLRVFFFF